MPPEIFIPFESVTKNDDGTVNVYGRVTSERLDADGQITDLNWFREQLPEWSKWSNIREMHKGSAVGIGLTTEDHGDSIWLESKIIDKEAAIKCEAGVYKGYSYGLKSVPGNPYKVIKDIGAPNGRICGGALVEISLVDRPANPDASFTLVKNEKLLEQEQSDIEKLTQAAELIRSVITIPPVQVNPVDTVKGLTLGKTYEEALGALLVSAGLQPTITKAAVCDTCKGTLESDGTCKTCAMKTVATTHPEEDETVDKATVVDFIKGMTAEERSEVGLVTQEDFESLKTDLAEMGKKIVPTGLHLGPAIPTIAKSTELTELEAEKETYTELAKAANPQTAQLAQMRLNEINKAIDAATPRPVA